MTDSTRRLTLDDFPETLRLGAEAFGPPPAWAPARETPEAWPPTGMHSWGTFRDGRLVAQLAVRADASWFDGTEVPTSGICGVTVAAEQRGEGLLTELFDRALIESRERGEVISTLYPTAPGIYRRFGYEIVGTLRRVEVPTAQLAGVRPAEGLRSRRATKDDAPAVAAAYTAWAREQNGPLTRTTALFDPGAVLDGAVTLVVDAQDEVRGCAAWTRSTGYGAESTLDVSDLVALDADANRALWTMIGSWSSVAGLVRLWTSGDDVTRLSLPGLAWREIKTNPYMLRILDVPGAFGLRSAPPGLSAELPFRVAGDRTGMIEGSYRLDVADGAIGCTSTSSAAASADPAARAGEAARARTDVRCYTPQGIALAWSGAQASADIRRAGHLTGPAGDDRTWDALFGRAQLHVRDYF